MSTQSHKEFGHFKSTDAPATEQARKAAHELVENAADKAGGVEVKLREEASRLEKVAEERKEEVRRQIDAGLARADAFIRERPLAAAGMAFAAGAVAALLLRRS